MFKTLKKLDPIDAVMRVYKHLICRAKTNWSCTSRDPFPTDNGPVADIDAANLVTSQLKNRPRMHIPLIDIDCIPVYVVPSRSGNVHLVIDHEVSFDKYVAILEALANAGIVEQGYLEATKRRGYGSLRIPGRKDNPNA